jgi:hypothetical protein
MSVVLVHGKDGEYTLKSGGVVLQGVTEVKRVVEDDVPYVEVTAELTRKEYVTEKPSAMILVVSPEGESLRHGDQFIEGLVDISEKDGIVKMKLEVSSEDYAPLRASKKEKKEVKKEVPKPVVTSKKVEEKDA